MLSEIDNQLFSNRCEVIQIGASHQFVYPIMKNGSSSFYDPIQYDSLTDFKIFDVENLTEAQAAQPFVTFLRDPKTRFISGVNTYLQHLDRDVPGLDHKTVLWFVDNYLFLNLHFCPQFFWLLNLAKILGIHTLFEFKTMSEISNYTSYHSKANVTPPTPEFLDAIENFNWQRLELYFYLDQVLLEMGRQPVSFAEILHKIKNIPVLREHFLSNTLNILNVLHELPKA